MMRIVCSAVFSASHFHLYTSSASDTLKGNKHRVNLARGEITTKLAQWGHDLLILILKK